MRVDSLHIEPHLAAGPSGQSRTLSETGGRGHADADGSGRDRQRNKNGIKNVIEIK